MKLYEIAEEYKGLLAMVDEGTLSAEDIADTLEVIDATFEDKLSNCMRIRQQLSYSADNFKAEAKRLNDLAASTQKQADSMSDYIRLNMIATGKDKISLDLWTLTLRKPSKKLGAIDEGKIDKKYFITVPASQKVNKQMLLADAKLGLVDVELIDNERGLTVK